MAERCTRGFPLSHGRFAGIVPKTMGREASMLPKVDGINKRLRLGWPVTSRAIAAGGTRAA